MIKSWLTAQQRVPCPYKKFALTEISEQRVIDLSNPDDVTLAYLGNLLIFAHGNPEMIKDDLEMLMTDTASLGLNFIKEYIENRILPKKSAAITRIGNLGEILAAQCMVDLADFSFPVYKLRYREKRNWAMRLTDLFLVKTQENGKITVCYGEVKTRSGATYTSSVKKVAVEAHESLKKDDALENPEILTFVRNLLYEQGRREEARIFGRIQNNLVEYDIYYALFLVHDTNIWREEILSELENHDIDVRLTNLGVHVLRISNLGIIIDQAYSNAWKGVVGADG